MMNKQTENIQHTPTKGLYGWITHTELASTDPAATKKWCAEVLGWEFTASFPAPDGDYHLFAYSDKGGGGIRQTNPSEDPGSTPFVHVENVKTAFEKALENGAEPVMPPNKAMEGVGLALVKAPGGVLIGFSGPSDFE
jgi:hypothetical protein